MKWGFGKKTDDQEAIDPAESVEVDSTEVMREKDAGKTASEKDATGDGTLEATEESLKDDDVASTSYGVDDLKEGDAQGDDFYEAPIKKEKRRPSLIADLLLILFAAGLLFGTKYLFHACAAQDDGMWMSCHYAEQAVIGVAAAIGIQAILVLITTQGIRRGLRLAILTEALLAVALPGILIELCMTADMRCHVLMRPATIVFGTIIIICAIVGFILDRKKKTRQ